MPVFSDIVAHTFPLLELLWLCLLRFCWGLWFIYASNFWKCFSFLLSSFSIYNNNFLIFFLELVISLVILKVLLHIWYPTHKWRVYQRIIAFKPTEMVCYNCSSLKMSVNDAKYIQFLPTFSTFTLQVWATHKITQVLFILLQMLVMLFVSIIIIDISYNLNKYLHYKHI